MNYDEIYGICSLII